MPAKFNYYHETRGAPARAGECGSRAAGEGSPPFPPLPPCRGRPVHSLHSAPSARCFVAAARARSRDVGADPFAYRERLLAQLSRRPHDYWPFLRPLANERARPVGDRASQQADSVNRSTRLLDERVPLKFLPTLRGLRCQLNDVTSCLIFQTGYHTVVAAKV